MKFMKQNIPGILVAAILAYISIMLSGLVPQNLIGGGVFALLIGMLLNPFISKYIGLQGGLIFTSKNFTPCHYTHGIGLNFTQVVSRSRSSWWCCLITPLGRLYHWKLFLYGWQLSSWLAGTGICGGSAVAALALWSMPKTVMSPMPSLLLSSLISSWWSYSLSRVGTSTWATWAIPGRETQWHSSVVAAGYAFRMSLVNFCGCKVDKNLSIIPVVLMFSYINQRLKRGHQQISMMKKVMKSPGVTMDHKYNKDISMVHYLFLLMVVIKA